MPSPLVEGLRIVQVALVTADLERCASEQSRPLGDGPWRVYQLGAHNIRDYLLHGRPATGSTLLALNDSSPQVEVLQPLDGTSTHRESLERDGEGIHHVAAIVPSVADAVAVAEANGIEVVSSGWGFGPDASGAFAYLDTRSMMGTLLEVFEPPTSLGEPVRVI